MVKRRVIRTVAAFEACKGVVVLLASLGFLSLIHKDMHELAVRLVEHTHLNPASKYPHIFIDVAGELQNSRLVLLAFGAAAYISVRFIEAYGLFNERAWAEALAAGSGAVYIPLEVLELFRDANWLGIALLVVNFAIVAIMIRALLLRRQAAATEK